MIVFLDIHLFLVVDYSASKTSSSSFTGAISAAPLLIVACFLTGEPVAFEIPEAEGATVAFAFFKFLLLTLF